jgi:SAM-dependent methyltransferase
MSLSQKVRNVTRALVQTYGPESAKRRLWNGEFAEGRWNCLDDTAGDFLYEHIHRAAYGGSILDLGCGSGSTGTELDPAAYGSYVGVDISDVAIEKARRRSDAAGRRFKNRYLQSDIGSYVPDRQFDVILFRDSIYYLPAQQVIPTLRRYASYLEPQGVFIVRMFDTRGKYAALVRTIETHCTILERHVSPHSGALILICRCESAS